MPAYEMPPARPVDVYCSTPAMGNSLVVKVHYTLGSRKCSPNGKGFHREVESEGSRRQSSEPTNRNRIRRRDRADEAATQVEVPYYPDSVT